MMMLAQKRSSPAIQVTVKQTETNPGLIGVVSPLLGFLTLAANVFLNRLPVQERTKSGVVEKIPQGAADRPLGFSGKQGCFKSRRKLHL